MNQKYLITYFCESLGHRSGYGMDVTSDPVRWLEETQDNTEETYFLINQLPITNIEAKRIDGNLKGM